MSLLNFGARAYKAANVKLEVAANISSGRGERKFGKLEATS